MSCQLRKSGAYNPHRRKIRLPQSLYTDKYICRRNVNLVILNIGHLEAKVVELAKQQSGTRALNLKNGLQTGLFIEGRWTDGRSTFEVHDKYTGEVIANVSGATADDVNRAVGALAKAFAKPPLTPIERARILRKAGELIAERRADFVETIVAETGFTHSDANGEVDRTIVTMNLCSEEATRIVGETVTFAASAGQHERIGYTIRVPLGIICAITPFNSPLNTVVHKIGPAIAAGNPVILKPSALTPLNSALLVTALLDAGMPPELIALTQGSGGTVGDALLEAQDIAFYSFTGSTRVGRMIQQKAGLRRTQLELGSIASTLVCRDADLDRALPKIANATFRKAGQVCTSIQRLYVEEAAVEEVTERLITEAKAMPHGDPRDPKTRVGPMITEDNAKRAETWIEEAQLGQARVVLGGERQRSVIPPTILTNVSSGLKVLDQEVFAPIISILPFRELREAVDHANNTPFGLAAGIFTRDVNKAMDAARTLRFGAIHINETSSSRGDAMPFGGVKDSGYGHEGPKYAIREVTEERLVTVNF